MEKIKLSEIQFQNILNQNFDDHFWYFELGRFGEPEKDFVDNEFSTDFYNSGINLWKKYKKKIAEIMCDLDKKVPQEWVIDLISGDIRNFIITIVTLLVSTYSIELSLAIPLVALALKHDINKFCEEI
ncbi:MAG: hypothetical protein ABI462_04570 [Ignavibacteria bacterium]